MKIHILYRFVRIYLSTIFSLMYAKYVSLIISTGRGENMWYMDFCKYCFDYNTVGPCKVSSWYRIKECPEGMLDSHKLALYGI